MMGTTTLDRATPTQRQCIERSRAFHASIAAHAVAQKPAPERSFAVKGDYVPPPRQTLEVPPQAFPAEPDPPFIPIGSYPSIRNIQKLLCTEYKVSLTDLISSRRTAQVVRPRQLAMYLAKTLTLRSLPYIGRSFGNRDHTTVLHAVRKITRLISKDAVLAEEIVRMTSILTPDEVIQSSSVPTEDETMKLTFYANIYKPLVGASGHVYASRELADQMAGRDRLACVAFESEIPASEGPDAASRDDQH